MTICQINITTILSWYTNSSIFMVNVWALGLFWHTLENPGFNRNNFKARLKLFWLYFYGLILVAADYWSVPHILSLEENYSVLSLHGYLGEVEVTFPDGIWGWAKGWGCRIGDNSRSPISIKITLCGATPGLSWVSLFQKVKIKWYSLW